MKLKGKTALVTGGAAGIGWGCAKSLAREGARVVINDRLGSEALLPAVEAFRAEGYACEGIEGDVFDEQARTAFFAEAVERFGPIDVFVSNPAFSRRRGFLDVPMGELRETFEGTLFSGFHLAQLMAKHRVAEGGGGSIVFVSSIHAHVPFARSAPYGAAKAGLSHLTRSLAVELIPHRIRVNSIEPGWIDTPGERKFFDDGTMQAVGEGLPWGRLGTPEDIGHAAAFLSSDEADYITGSVLVVDGGIRFKDCLASELMEDLGE